MSREIYPVFASSDTGAAQIFFPVERTIRQSTNLSQQQSASGEVSMASAGFSEGGTI